MVETTALPLEKVVGVESWRLACRSVDLAITQLGGMVGPVSFKLGNKRVTPYSVAPWAEEKVAADTPNLLKVLRGDFFCAPFGGNDKPLGDKKYPPHGESANRPWQLLRVEQSGKQHLAELQLRTVIRTGEIRKLVRLVEGHTCVYQRHTLSGFSGPMPAGHHAMLKFPEEPMSGLVSTAPFTFGQVFPGAFENPALGGYQSLKPGATFKNLHQVPMIDGNAADLSHYPARPGFEDLVMLVTSPRTRLGWSAVTFPREGYIWFSLKDTRILPNTVFWISNGGRHYAPWSGRHTRVLGIEEVSAYFHYGIAESTNLNPLTKEGHKTALDLQPDRPTVVNYIQGIAPVPVGFERVASLKPAEDGKSITLTSTTGHETQAPVDLSWLEL